MMQLIKRLLGGNSIGIIAVLYHVVITVLMLLPSANISYINVSHFDKLIHTGIYVFLFVFWAFTRLRNRKLNPNYAWVAIGLFIYGIVIEVLQEKWIVTRTFDFWDIVANTVGIVIGFILFHELRKRFSLKN